MLLLKWRLPVTRITVRLELERPQVAFGLVQGSRRQGVEVGDAAEIDHEIGRVADLSEKQHEVARCVEEGCGRNCAAGCDQCGKG